MNDYEQPLTLTNSQLIILLLLLFNNFCIFCRVLGSLLSAHLIIVDPHQPLGNMSIPGYENELLDLAHDLATRLLPAFSNTATGIPYPRVI